MDVELTEIDAGQWQGLLDDSPYALPYHHAGFLQAAIAHLGGQLRLFACTPCQGGPCLLIPVFTGEPWAKPGCFSTAAIGSGGPIPTASVLTMRPCSLASYLNAALQATAERVILKLQRAVLSPLLTAASGPLVPWQPEGLTAILPLSADLDALFHHRLTGNVRTAIRKSHQSDLHFLRVTHGRAVHQACALIHQTQGSVGASYRTPEGLLFSLLENCGDLCEIFAAQRHDRLIAAAVCLRQQAVSCHWLHGWERAQAPSCANQGVMWQMITASAQTGARVMDLGLSQSQALLTAKRRWGAETSTVYALKPAQR